MKTTSPAQQAGLQAGDEFISINHQPVSGWKQVQDALSLAKAGEPLPLTIQRNGNPLDLAITPVDRRDAVLATGEHVKVDNTNAATGFIGIQPKLHYETVGPVKATTQSASVVGHGTVAVFRAFGDMFSPSGLKLYYQNVTNTVPEAKQVEADQNRFVSPVGLVGYANDAAKSGWFAVLSLLFSINLFIGIFNMFPLLPFDGGHVAVAIYERIRSIKRPTYHADYAKLVPVSYAMILVLLLIASTSLWLDVTNPLPNQFK
jgi:membrane-associated protease RseP (regulator of RpoE activity)